MNEDGLESSLDDGRITFEREPPDPLEPKLMQRDPVCGVDVDPVAAATTRQHRGQTYYFCSLTCRDDFDRDPKRYVGA
jgi:YHS domain-containing protein